MSPRRILPLALLLLAACQSGGPASHAVGAPLDTEVRGPAPDVSGDWAVSEDDKPRVLWHITQNDTTLTGTIGPDPRDPKAAGLPSQPLKGTLVGVGTTWQARFDAPLGYWTFDQTQTSFRFCPVAGGTGGCRTGKRQFGPIVVGSGGAASPAAGGASPPVLLPPVIVSPSPAPSGSPAS